MEIYRLTTECLMMASGSGSKGGGGKGPAGKGKPSKAKGRRGGKSYEQAMRAANISGDHPF